MTRTISRRTLLRGTGVAVALPLLECMAAPADGESTPRRMVAINFELSFHQPNLIPEAPGTDYELPRYLQPLADLRNDFTIVSGTSHPGVDGGHAASVSWLTGATHPAAAGFRNSISIDQLAARHVGHHTRFASRQFGTGISISANGVKVPGSPYPERHFQDMFLAGRPDEKRQQLERLRDGRSVLDVVMESSRRMQRRVGSRDRRKLDEYLTAVREAERSLEKSERWHEQPKPTVDASPPNPIRDRARVVQRAEQFYDVMFLALQTDSTRLITYVVNDGTHVPVIPGVTQNYHNLSHHGRDPEKLRQLALVEAEYLKLFGKFLRRLRDAREGDSNLLERTQVLLGSHMHDGGHNNRNLPILLAGGGFRHGHHLAFDRENNTPLANLHVTMLQRLGIPVDRFATSTGTLAGFT